MALSPGKKIWILSPGMGLLVGFIFSFLMGGIDPSRYLIEQMTIMPLEVPFIILTAVLVRKYGILPGAAYAVAGTVGSALPFFPAISIPPMIFARICLTGLIIGAIGYIPGRFSYRLGAAALPGVILAGVIGLPLVINGVSPDILDGVKKESLELYKAFMTPEDASNAAENATSLLQGMFGVSFAVLALSSIVQAWLSFLFLGWAGPRAGIEVERVPSMMTFSTPFAMIWVFLVCFGLVLLEYAPVFPLALNGLIVVAGLYGIQGTAIISWHMARASLGRIPRILFWLIFFITLAFSSIFLIVTGIIDNWYTLRPSATAPGAGDRGEGTDHESNTER